MVRVEGLEPPWN